MDLFTAPSRQINSVSTAAGLTRRPLSPHPHSSTKVHSNILTPPSSSSAPAAMKPRESLKRIAGSSAHLATPKRRKIIANLLTPPRSSASSSAPAPGTNKRPLLAGRSSSVTLDLPPSSPLMRREDLLLPSSPLSASIAIPSSPIRPSRLGAILTSSNPLPIPFDGTFILVIGRSRHITSRQQPLLDNPELASKLSSSPGTPVRFSSLPRGAAHASRHHVAVEYLAATDEIKIVVLGQNGCKVRLNDGQIKRFGQHRVAMLERPSGAPSTIEIDFYSCKVSIPWPETIQQHPPPSSPLSSPMMGNRVPYPIRSSSVTVPFSSPLQGLSSRVDLIGSSDLSSEAGEEEEEEEEDEEEEQEEEENDDEDEEEVQPIKSRSSSLSAPEHRNSKKFRIATTPDSPIVAASHQRTSSAVESVVNDISPPADVDLFALIANTLVFSGHSASALPDVVKSILETQPSLRDYGSEQYWSTCVKHTLFAHPMFGKVDRKGKDASGKSLLPLFFYLPAEDEDRQRALELGSLVRPLRGVQQRGGKAIDWRPVGGGRRRRDGEGE